MCQNGKGTRQRLRMISRALLVDSIGASQSHLLACLSWRPLAAGVAPGRVGHPVTIYLHRCPVPSRCRGSHFIVWFLAPPPSPNETGGLFSLPRSTSIKAPAGSPWSAPPRHSGRGGRRCPPAGRSLHLGHWRISIRPLPTLRNVQTCATELVQPPKKVQIPTDMSRFLSLCSLLCVESPIPFVYFS